MSLYGNVIFPGGRRVHFREISHFIALRPREGPDLPASNPTSDLTQIPCEKTSLPGGGGKAFLLEPKKSDVQTSSAESVSPRALGSLLSARCCGHSFPRPPTRHQRSAGTHTLSDSLLHLVPGLSVPTRGTWGLGRQERCRDSLGIFLDRPHIASRGHPSSSLESLETTHPMAAGRGVWELPRDPSELQHLLGAFKNPHFSSLVKIFPGNFCDSPCPSHQTSRASLLEFMACDLRCHSGPCT